MITKRNGNGQTICKGCKEKGKFGLTWDSFLYNFNNEPYCLECLFEILEDLQQRIDKAIELIINIYSSLENVDRPIIFYEKILEILKGDSNV